MPTRPTSTAGRLLAGLALAAAVATAPVAAQPVIQPLPDPAAGDLSDALQRLGRDPQSLQALVDAGDASLKLDDVDAAQSFYMRGQAIAPEDGRVLAGLAQVELTRNDPVQAIGLFDRAERAGQPMAPYEAARGLAYDLVGANGMAQAHYGAALRRQEDPEIIKRLALSYAISGDQAASEATLLPLLQAQDLGAFRMRAFALAISGKTDEAVSIAETMLPVGIARRLAPYLTYLPRLTRAQQAAAANFGVFPATSEIGRDKPEIAAYAASAGSSPAPVVARQGADARLIPGGEPLGPTSPQAAAQSASASGELPPAGDLAASASQDQASLPVDRTVPNEVLATASRPAPSGNGFQGEPPVEPVRVDLARAFADLELEPLRQPGYVSPDAVDIRSINAPRDAVVTATADQPSQLAVNPGRHWVQVATGQDATRFGYDWKRLVGTAGGQLADRSAFYAVWGNTNRLLTGPFPTEREAQDLVTRLKVAGVDSFTYTSKDGERVYPVS